MQVAYEIALVSYRSSVIIVHNFVLDELNMKFWSLSRLLMVVNLLPMIYGSVLFYPFFFFVLIEIFVCFQKVFANIVHKGLRHLLQPVIIIIIISLKNS